jgi:hypothetical protein
LENRFDEGQSVAFEPRGSGCGAQFADLPPRRPPDLPAALRMRVIRGGKA